jgi:hypothetical protein
MLRIKVTTLGFFYVFPHQTDHSGFDFFVDLVFWFLSELSPGTPGKSLYCYVSALLLLITIMLFMII